MPQQPDIAGFINAARQKGTSDSEIYDYLKQKGLAGQTQAPAPVAPKPSYAGDVGKAFNDATSQTGDALGQITNPSQPTETPIRTGLAEGLKAASGIASAVSAPIAPLMAPVSKLMQTYGDWATSDKNPFNTGGEKGMENFANSDAGKTTAAIAEPLANAGNVAGTILGVDQLVKGAPTALKTAQDLGQKADTVIKGGVDTLKAAATPSEEALNAKILDKYNKAISPSVAGKGTIALKNAYNSNVVSGIKSIVDNKDGLKFTTPDGEEVTGRTPQSPMETAQAIDQTKRSIFDKYDALTKQAGGEGVKIDTAPIAGELDKVITNEALQISHPEAVKYAQDMKARLAEAKLPDGSPMGSKKLDPATTQEIIKNYNTSLEAFYKSPSYDNASKAAIDAGLVHNFREQLGNAIQGATGEDYAALKKQYGALSAIEKDVNKRASVIARQSGGGLSDYANVFAGGDMVSGILSLNPALFAKGAAQASFTRFFKYLKSPDRAIKGMFDAAQKTPTTAQKVAGAIGEPSLGLSAKSVTGDTTPQITPEHVAKNMDDGDFHTLTSYVKNPSDLNAHMSADPLMGAVGISKLSHDDQIRFLKEALAKYEADTTTTVKPEDLK